MSIKEKQQWNVGGGWGDCITISNHSNLSVDGTMRGYGFKPLLIGQGQRFPKDGDELLCEFASGVTRTFHITSISFPGDPEDMFFWTAQWDGKEASK